MMKILINILLLLAIHQFAFTQITDTLPVHNDTNSIKTENLPVLADTIHYNDTSIKNTAGGKDTVIKKKVHSPQQATIRSAIIPGLGQIYNRKYWKVPIVYAAIGIPGYLFFDNKRWYKKTRYALSIVANNRYTADSLSQVDPQLKALVTLKAEGSLINYRNQFRRNMDYSVLFTLVMWGLNIVDATVDGHLRGFDVGDELSLKIKPALMPGTMAPGVSLVVNFKQKNK
jgi:hypothetical protein